MQFADLKNFATRNAGLRAIAIALALGLWLFVNAGQHDEQTSLEVPVNYRRLPSDMVITNQHPDFVRVEVSGPRTLLSLLDPDRLEVRLDLADAAVGQVSFRIMPEMFNVPRETNVTQISPSQIMLDIDRIVTHQIPIYPDLIGSAAAGFTIAGVDLNLTTVTVSGPSRDVSRLQRIDTEPLDVKGLTAPLDRTVLLDLPPGPLKFSATEVEAHVKIDEVMGEREFRTVTLKVRDPDYHYRLYTAGVSVTVHGPARKLPALKLDGMVYVTAKGERPGTYVLPVQVDLPDGFQVVRASPDKVKLRILGSKVDARS
jgi:YbbR domain-containing protein